jgi:hypothetical protein
MDHSDAVYAVSEGACGVIVRCVRVLPLKVGGVLVARDSWVIRGKGLGSPAVSTPSDSTPTLLGGIARTNPAYGTPI